MTLNDFISLEFSKERTAILAAAAVAGLSNALALVVISAAAATAATSSFRSFFLFAGCAVVHLVAARYTSHRANAVIDRALHHTKARIVEKVERTELARLEQIGTSEIFDRITQNMAVISGAASAVGGILQAVFMFLFSLFYLAWLSPVAFAILLPLQLGAFYLYRSRGKRVGDLVEVYARKRIQFLDMLADLLKGAKEIKLHRGRSKEILKDFEATSASLRDTSATTTQIFDDSNLFMNCNLYLLLAALVFVLPQHAAVDQATLSKLVTLMLFVWGSLQAGLAGYPMYILASQALGEIGALEKKLEGTARVEVESDPWSGTPGRISASQVEYDYPTANGDGAFGIGPIDLTIEPGEILFIVGGNGAGKSTLLKVLTGLYPPTRGTLLAGDVSVRPHNVAAYRETISTIFSDFHLFSKVYGLLDVAPGAVVELLREMQMERKTSFMAGRFTRQDLSTGQKKRLAMVVAILEERPILVLDEWAADQDPEFRKFFYEAWLPLLKRRGKTVIAVSHDDRYFHCADRVVTMEYGQIRTVQQPPHAVSPPGDMGASG